MSENMLFCLGNGKYSTTGDGYMKSNMVFNTKVTSEEFIKIRSSLPVIKLDIVKYNYKESWANAWKKLSDGDKQKILDIPQFNPEIFKRITGIDVVKKEPETIKIGGKEYVVTDELKTALNSLKEI